MRLVLMMQTLDEAVSVDAMDSPLNRLILDLVLYAGKQQWQGGARVGDSFEAIHNIDC